MPKFYFHLRDGADVMLDPEGITCPAGAVAAKALAAARGLIADDALSGTIDLHCRIEVEDTAGAIVHTIAFPDAVAIRRE